MNRAIYNNEPAEVTKNDVLCGRSPEEQCHPGNIRLKNCIELHRAKYAEANKANKSKIIRQIVDTIGARFLKKNKDGVYIVIPPRGAREKVGLAMREAMEPNKQTKAKCAPAAKRPSKKTSDHDYDKQKVPLSAVSPLSRNISAPDLNVMSASAIANMEPTPEVNVAVLAQHSSSDVHHAQKTSSPSLSQAQAQTPASALSRAAADIVGESDMSEFLSSLDDAFLIDVSVPFS
uniref:DUF6824 domain-containing protein n=1 Tax=Leptocylindrus danicus TaxID=163516 RepID=A0A7S2NRI9_9STRA|mmetsp:Transcript_11085/g.16783  ORF Transcript_11085/g.16783 Transcript_11085/m.16783 type:complete len:233 (+) Transcript_11085:131-829(+)|eukprot:CAMPEP_0116021840 /NCGR_PEP_ID=MMETSP0321-20121206/10628_1 /TAXON_ID=163516 /ORGANISM="Leptocylindrus danicus var. danicus, Strain B650" /LENGTH=232 /DNA_ID=CAMNT_0003492791 /DNA_START=23 /DNA_END=721 /DNA_ORIENTATION=+